MTTLGGFGKSGWISTCFALSVGALLWTGGCSSSSGSGASCDAYCEDVCAELDACGVSTDASCVGQCSAGMGSSCRGARPANQLTCAEVQDVQACAGYCAVLCERAPECGSFDQGLCRAGCAAERPDVCNPASVEARSCDVLKPELRLYDDAARAARDGDDFVSGGFGPRFGLCETAEDCEEPLGCSLETNTCAPCTTNGDCAQSYGSFVCTEERACQEVECLVDDDCSSGICDPTTHQCGDCRSDADCKGLFGACNTATSACVQCTSDAQCSQQFAPFCNLAENRCVECSSNEQCTDAFFPRCDQSALGGFCTTCEVDADCAQTGLPICASECVECITDADCTDPQKPSCTFDHTCTLK
jgi:hypothetical protein